MLIQSEIETTVGPKNAKYWSEKGYSFPPVGGRAGKNGHHKIKVKVSDLQPHSNQQVKCRCDDCNIEYSTRVCRNTDRCRKCASRKSALGNTHGSVNKKYPNPGYETLHKMHFDMGMSKEDIRRHYKVTRPVVDRWFRENNITPNNHLKRLDIPKRSTLLKLHVEKQLLLSSIAKRYNTNTEMVRKWFTEYHIQIIDYPYVTKKKDVPEKEELENLHIEQKKTLLDISKIYKTVPGVVKKWFDNQGIELRLHKSPESNAEREIRETINSWGMDFVKTRKILANNKELDMYSETHKFAIEYCGLYWHQEDRVGKRYHIDKLNECESKGIQLITIFEDEWLEKPEIVLSIIKSKLGLSSRLYARKCEVRSIPKFQAHEFLLGNHIQGSTNSISHAYGLFHNGQIVAVMTFGKHHRGRPILVLNRLCFLKDHTVIGGAQKIFKRALQDINEPIISWSDRRWSQGRIYEALGFQKEEILGPDYSYVIGQERVSKQSRKKSIIGCPSNIKEIEFNQNLGFEPIWDCGKVSWIYQRNSTTK